MRFNSTRFNEEAYTSQTVEQFRLEKVSPNHLVHTQLQNTAIKVDPIFYQKKKKIRIKKIQISSFNLGDIYLITSTNFWSLIYYKNCQCISLRTVLPYYAV